ncbi:hypothetical protein B0H17DRAFT_1238234, partial [Mycena rosella]
PLIFWENGQGRITDQLRAAGAACAKLEQVKAAQSHTGRRECVSLKRSTGLCYDKDGNDIYTPVKHYMPPFSFGDIAMGVATQCLKSSTANVFALNRNIMLFTLCIPSFVTLGDINTIPALRPSLS